MDDDRFKADLAEMIDQTDTKYSEFVKLDKAAKSAKKSWEAMVEEVLAMGRRSKEEHPLFDGHAEVNSTFVPAGGEVVDADYSLRRIEGPEPEVEPAAEKEDESWRSIEVAELHRHGLSDSVITKLYDAGMSTIGAMSNWSQSGKRLIDISGIGESKAAEIDDALEAFWQEWRHKQAKKPESDAAEDEPKKGRKRSA